MCVTNKTIYTNAHKLFYNRYQPYETNIPCGQCTECLKARENEYKTRNYYQYLECIEKGGYAIWDTLTYNEDNVPYLNKVENHVPDKLNFMCFNREHIQLFLKRLRENLYKKGYGRKNIKYIIAGEYGQDERFTQRPHYHTLIYVNAPIDPISMSKEISAAWPHGHTDGVEYKGAKYFWEEGYIANKGSALRVGEYIGKYCLKNNQYDKVAEEKIKALCKFWYQVENNLDEYQGDLFKKPEWRKRKNDILRKIKTFNLHSIGYGEYALEKDVIKEGKIGTPDRKKIYWWQKLPMYYQRKIYYTYQKINNKIVWKLNDVGIAWKQHNLKKCIEKYAQKLQNLEIEIQTESARQIIAQTNYYNNKHYDDSRWYTLNDRLFAYRNGRNWKEYAEYIMYHRGRIWEGIEIQPELTIELNSNASIAAEKNWLDERLIYNYCHRVDIDEFKHQIVSNKDLGDNKNGYKKTDGTEIKPEQFKQFYCINENSLPKWNDFDKLKDTIDEIQWYLEENNKQVLKTKKRMQEAKKNGIYTQTKLF